MVYVIMHLVPRKDFFEIYFLELLNFKKISNICSLAMMVLSEWHHWRVKIKHVSSLNKYLKYITIFSKNPHDFLKRVTVQGGDDGYTDWGWTSWKRNTVIYSWSTVYPPYQENISSRLSSNSEAFASELVESLEE